MSRALREFTKAEQERLRPFVSNLDKSVFILKNLPQEVAGALFSRYSRTAKSVRRLLLDEFLESDESGLKKLNAASVFNDSAVRTERARDFFARILAGYGDDSIGELGGVHIAVENVSNIACKVLEDARIGLSPLEKSSRYVRFDDKVDGRYRFYQDPDVAKSPHAKRYNQALTALFDTYAGLIEPMIAWVKEQFPQQPDESDRAYEAATKAKALDSIRGLLPAATLTNVGIFGNGRAFEYLLTKMYASDLTEIRELAASIHAELRTVIPSLVARANDEKYGQASIEFIKATRTLAKKAAAKELQGSTDKSADAPLVTLVDYDRDAEDKVLAALLYPETALSLDELRKQVKTFSAAKRHGLMQELAAKRGNRRHRPGRAFENTSYQFDFVVNFGAYRDLQRHRMLSQERQLLTVAHGYDMSKEVVTAGHERVFRAAMDQVAEAYAAIAPDFPEQAQYVVPFGYRLRYRMTLSLRELYHLVELRSTPQGHPDYRLVAQEMYRRVKDVHPLLVSAMTFVDLSASGELERRESEKKTDRKLEAIKKKRV